MAVLEYFVTTSNVYHELYARASEVFRLDKEGLPEQIFASGFLKFRALEFDLMLAPKFWHVLTACATHCGDTEISVIVHNPDPETYYFSHFRRYGALRFQRNASADDYSAALLAEPVDSPADALQYVASTVSWCGSSKQWGIWGERDYGIGIAATCCADLSWPVVQGIKWFDIQSALSDLIALNFRGHEVPPEFAARFRTHYAS